jgi:hypothetical protein
MTWSVRKEPHAVKSLLIVTAILEVGAGAALICLPSFVTTLLLDVPLTTPEALVVARVGGAGLLALGVACWLARGDAQSRAANALVAGILAYNVSAVIVLGYAGVALQQVGIVLWPAVVLHVAMAGWCVLCLRATPMQ